MSFTRSGGPTASCPDYGVPRVSGFIVGDRIAPQREIKYCKADWQLAIPRMEVHSTFEEARRRAAHDSKIERQGFCAEGIP